MEYDLSLVSKKKINKMFSLILVTFQIYRGWILLYLWRLPIVVSLQPDITTWKWNITTYKIIFLSINLDKTVIYVCWLITKEY